jgi:glycosyltransferase involved in cell wall biosynthesis
MNKKKISFFIPSLRGGGAERVFVNLANEFSKRGFDVDLVLAQKIGPYLKEANKDVNIVDLKAKRVLYSLFPLVKYLRKEKPPVLFSSLDHINVFAVLAKMVSRSKTKVVIRIANNFSLSIYGTNIFRRFLRRCSAVIFFRFADQIIAVSNGVADDLSRTLKISREKIKVIYNPTITPSVFKKAKEEVSHLWLKEKKEPVILSVGRLHNQKDYPNLIKAFNLLKQRKVKLIILGTGKEKENLNDLISKFKINEKVDILGFEDNPYAYMSKADVFVLSSKSEGLPNTLIEAMACGIPVVSTDCPSGPSEILRDGKYGELVPVGDAKKLAEKINYVLNLSEEERRKIGEKARKSVEERFSVEKVVDKYEKLYKSIIKF